MTTNSTTPTNPAQQLEMLGFTEYEARAYVALLEHGELSGYAWARHSGIPRPNIYAVAEKLAVRGAVQRRQGPRGQTWSAVAANALLAGMREQYRRSLAQARQSLGNLQQSAPSAQVFNLRDDELLTRARQLVDACRENLLIALQPQEATAMAASLRQAEARGVAITTLCLEACEQPCGGCQGEVHRHQLAPRDGVRWLVITADHEHALLGQSSDRSTEGVVTAQHLIVELAEAYIRQSLALATLGTELDGRLNGLVSNQANDLLASLFPDGLAPITSES